MENKAVNGLIHHISPDLGDRFCDLVLAKQRILLTIDNAPLIIGDVIVLQQLLADIEVPSFHLALGLLDGIGDHTVFDGLALLHAQRLHEALDPVRGEDVHRVIFRGTGKTATPRIPLPP